MLETSSSIVEVCNGIDDDCDGFIDEEVACLTIEVAVEPFSGDSIVTWYSYGEPAGSSANADLAISNNAIAYFHGWSGNLSAAVTLDQPSDGSGETP